MRKPTQMRVLMLCTIFPPAIGGPATQSFNLCQALLGHNVFPVVVTYGNEFAKNSPDGYPVYTFRRYYGLGPLDRILRWVIFPFYLAYILRKEKIAILHCHSVNILSFTAAALAKLLGIPRVIKFAGDWVWETLSTKKLRGEDFKAVYSQSFYSRILTFVEKKGLKLFDIIWTPSEFRRENIQYLLGRGAKTVIIPNCLILRNKKMPEKPASDKIIMVSANRFIPHKRIPFLVEAYAMAATSKTKLILIGGGDEEEIQKVKAKIEELNIADSVTLTGILPSEELYRQFLGASLYVSSSLEEGFPNVFIEAMNFALPIVATDVGGSKELVVDGKTGFLVPPHDKKALAEKLNLLIRDGNLRNQFANNSFERSKLFDLKERIGEFIFLYQSLLK